MHANGHQHQPWTLAAQNAYDHQHQIQPKLASTSALACPACGAPEPSGPEVHDYRSRLILSSICQKSSEAVSRGPCPISPRPTQLHPNPAILHKFTRLGAAGTILPRPIPTHMLLSPTPKLTSSHNRWTCPAKSRRWDSENGHEGARQGGMESENQIKMNQTNP